MSALSATETVFPRSCGTVAAPPAMLKSIRGSLATRRSDSVCPGCKGRNNVEFLGKIFDTVCGCWPHFQWNLAGEALEYAKQLILINKNIVDDILE